MTTLVTEIVVVLRLAAEGTTVWTGVSPTDQGAMFQRGQAVEQAGLQGWLTADAWRHITDAGRDALTRLETSLG